VPISDPSETIKPTGLRSYRGGRPKGVRNRPPPDMEPEWARVPETAARFRISATKLKQWIRTGDVVSRKIGNIRLVQIASVRRLLAAGSQ
jgi:hypothetical protein